MRSADGAPEPEDRLMHVIRRRGWEIPERHATPEHLFLDRRAFLAAAEPGDRAAAAAPPATTAAAGR